MTKVNRPELRAALPGFGLNDYLRHLKPLEEGAADGIPIRVAVVRSYTVEPLEPVLKVRLLLEGYKPEIWFGGYNQHVQEMLDTSSPLYAFHPHVVLVMVRLEELLPDFIDDFPSADPAQWQERLASRAGELAQLAGRVATTLSAQVIVQNANLSQPYYGIFDAQHQDGHGHLARRFNEALARSVAGLRGVFVWDFERYVNAVGLDTLNDAKAWYVSRNPFKPSAYPSLVDDLFRYLLAALGRVKKCVVLDLDNTLWGGVVGEEGLEGIALGHTYPGNCYRDFQQELLKLYHRGILLAIASKNNPDDALRVLDEHPDMVLRREHFAAMRINWQDKASNLRNLVNELNIGMDSVVFVDDNEVECELIRRECPGCDVVLLPPKPYLIPATARRLPGIENIQLTAEDRAKSAMYRANAARREQQQRHSNIDDFLRSLEMEVEIQAAAPFSIPRIAQLTQKTNQWNMTTRRYTEAEIEAFARDPGHAVLSVASRDRFGSDGIVGVCILEFAGDVCVIDTFLLSCRVIGRGIEQLMLAEAARLARTRGARTLAAEFVSTRKNRPAEGFYERAGLQREPDGWFRANLATTAFHPPAHIRSAPAGTAPAATS